jgi:hypothetical protein
MTTTWRSPRSHPYPPLENGYRLAREEFHRRYEQHPELQHVELVEGVVYMPSPIRFERHAEEQAAMISWLGLYAASRANVRVGGPTTVMLDGENEPEPDAVMMLRPEAGGQAL